MRRIVSAKEWKGRKDNDMLRRTKEGNDDYASEHIRERLTVLPLPSVLEESSRNYNLQVLSQMGCVLQWEEWGCETRANAVSLYVCAEQRKVMYAGSTGVILS